MKVRVDPTPEQRVHLNQALGANKSQYNGSIAAHERAYRAFRNYEISLGFLEGWDTCEEKRRPRHIWELSGWARLWGFTVVIHRLTARSAKQQRWGVGLIGNGRMTVRSKPGLDQGRPRIDTFVRFLSDDRRLRDHVHTVVQAVGTANPYDYRSDVTTPEANAIRASLDYQGVRDSIDSRSLTPYMGYLPGSAARDTTAAMKAAMSRAFKGKGGFPRYKGRYQSRLSMAMSPGGAVKGPNVGQGQVDWQAVAERFGSDWEYAEYPISPMTPKAKIAEIKAAGMFLMRNGGQIDVRPWTRGPTTRLIEGQTTYPVGSLTEIVWRDSVRIPWSRTYKGDVWVPCSRSNYLPRTGQDRHVKYSAVCVSREGNDFYVSITCSFDVPDPKPRNGRTCGVDVGIKTNLVVTSSTLQDGRPTIRVGRYRKQLARLQRLERRLKLVQRRASRRVGPVVLDSMGRATRLRREPSHRWSETNREASELQRTIGRIRNDMRHQSTSRAIRGGYSEFVHEGLDLTELLNKETGETRKDRRLRQTFRRIGAGEIFRQLSYKADWSGATTRSAFSAYGSKQCPVELGGCGAVNYLHGAQDLFQCPSCGFGVQFGTHVLDSGLHNNHRDVVAAANMRGPKSSEDIRRAAFANRKSSETIPRTRDRQSGVKSGGNRKRVSTEIKTASIEQR